jgi:poly(A) polymerase
LNVIPRDQHCISRKNISDNALKVMSRLREHDYEAYLVGGAVRDLLLGGHPKDFDIATNATPEQVHSLFRNSRLIGRRFRIVHVHFGREVIEVTTFRGHHDQDEQTNPRSNDRQSRRSASGMLLRDNVFGTLEEDAVRRDLTINALYYDASNFSVFDHVHGLEDLEDRLVCIIGDPQQRYREDPVRMLRVLRFAAKLDFDIETATAEGIDECAALLADIPAARLFDEFLKLFLAGHGETTLDFLLDFQLLDYLFPQTVDCLESQPCALPLLRAAMASTDQRIRQDKSVTPAFLLAALLWPPVCDLERQLQARGDTPMVAIHSAGQQILARQVQVLSIPKRFSQVMREIWEFQLRLTRCQGRKAAELVDHRRFRAAYDFLLLREQAGEDTGGLGDWWTTFQELSFNERLEQAGGSATGRKRPPRKRPRKPAPQQAGGERPS